MEVPNFNFACGRLHSFENLISNFTDTDDLTVRRVLVKAYLLPVKQKRKIKK
jgi:hypothetical protein